VHLPEVRPETHTEFSLDWQRNSPEILPGLQGYQIELYSSDLVFESKLMKGERNE
jgi:hypothetical protein